MVMMVKGIMMLLMAVGRHVILVFSYLPPSSSPSYPLLHIPPPSPSPLLCYTTS